jgi:hypothetical protein
MQPPEVEDGPRFLLTTESRLTAAPQIILSCASKRVRQLFL